MSRVTGAFGQVELTPEQEAEARELEQKLEAAVMSDFRQMCRLMASKEDHELLGQTEFEMRDLAHQLASRALQEGVNARSKKGVPR